MAGRKEGSKNKVVSLTLKGLKIEVPPAVWSCKKSREGITKLCKDITNKEYYGMEDLGKSTDKEIRAFSENTSQILTNGEPKLLTKDLLLENLKKGLKTEDKIIVDFVSRNPGIQQIGILKENINLQKYIRSPKVLSTHINDLKSKNILKVEKIGKVNKIFVELNPYID